MSTVLLWAKSGRRYCISGYHIRVAAVQLAEAGLIRIIPLPLLPDRKLVRHLELHPTRRGRQMWRQHLLSPCRRTAGGATSSPLYRAASQALRAEVERIGRL